YAVGIYKWLAREKQERAVRVKPPREDVCCGVSVRRARMINRARGEAIHEQYDVTPRHGPLRRTLDHRFGQSGAAVKCDDRRKRSIPFRLREKAPKPVTWYVLRNFPTLSRRVLPCGIEFYKLRGCGKGVATFRLHRAAKYEGDCA